MLPSEKWSERLLTLVVHGIAVLSHRSIPLFKALINLFGISVLFLCAPPTRCGFMVGALLATLKHDTRSDVEAYGDIPRV